MQGLVQQQWLVPIFPLVAAAVQSLLPRTQRKLSAGICIAAMAASFVVAARAFVGTLGHHELVRETWNFTWFDYGTTSLQIGFILDPLTAAMAAMVTFVGLMIFIFATGYMHEDTNFTRFFCFLSLFAAAMLGLVVANNLLMLFMCWELVGLCSYLLIGFWYHKPSAALAMKKAFITTRIGDVGFFIGILMLYWRTGTLNLYTLEGTGALQQAGALGELAGWWGLSAAGFIALMLFIGAIGKSAQFPLHVWLPDAMEGPTPVSALIHAATMVAAGVFMVGRMYPLFIANEADWVMDFVMWTGCLTAAFSATIAVAQWDIKRVLAYSTCSQLGFMVMALGAGGLVAGQFHLLAHAFFKALLFLGSGSVSLGTHHEQDMRKMGGLRKYMPVTFLTYLIGTLALVGVFPFAGFFSKDAVLLATFHQNKLAWSLATGTAFLTAFYMTRQICLVFFGPYRGHDHPHETPWNMTGPLVILSLFAVGFGFTESWYHHYLTPADPVEPAGKTLVMSIATTVGLAGIVLGWWMYSRKPMLSPTGPDPLEVAAPPLFRVLNRKWYVDEFYEATVIRLTMMLGQLSRLFDKLVIDGLLHASARVTWRLSQVLQWAGDELLINGGFDAGCQAVCKWGQGLARLQDGRIQDYLRVVCLGTGALLLLWFLL